MSIARNDERFQAWLRHWEYRAELVKKADTCLYLVDENRASSVAIGAIEEEDAADLELRCGAYTTVLRALLGRQPERGLRCGRVKEWAGRAWWPVALLRKDRCMQCAGTGHASGYQGVLRLGTVMGRAVDRVLVARALDIVGDDVVLETCVGNGVEEPVTFHADGYLVAVAKYCGVTAVAELPELYV